MNKITKLKVDFSAIFWTKFQKYKLIVFKTISTLLTYCNCKIRKIGIGNGCEFYGVPTLHRVFLAEIKIGKKCRFRSDTTSNLVGINRKCIIATMRENAKITIGNNSGFSGTVVTAAKNIKIGNNVLCGANTLITDFDWHQVDPYKRLHEIGNSESRPINIKDNVWLGVNVIVLKGVTIGENSVIGANSVVIKNIPPNVIAAGNPCNIIKTLLE